MFYLISHPPIQDPEIIRMVNPELLKEEISRRPDPSKLLRKIRKASTKVVETVSEGLSSLPSFVQNSCSDLTSPRRTSSFGRPKDGADTSSLSVKDDSTTRRRSSSFGRKTQPDTNDASSDDVKKT